MTNLLTVEEEAKELPILCIFAKYSPFISLFLKENIGKFRIIFVAPKKPTELSEQNAIYFLTYEEIQLIPRLEEKIDYALISLSDIKEKQYLSSLTSKLTHDNTQTLFIINASKFKDLYDVVLEHKHEPNYRFSLLGELLSRNSIEGEDELSKIIHNAIQNGEMNFGGNDLYPVYAITIKDALTGVYRLLFGNFKSDNLYYLFYAHPETLLSAIHLLGRVLPDIKISFQKSERETLDSITREELENITKTTLQMKGEYMDEDLAGFEKGISRLISENEIASNEEIGEVILESRKEKVKKKRFTSLQPKIQFIVLSLFFGCLLFLIVNAAFLGVGLFFLKDAINNIKSDNFKMAAKNASLSEFFLSAIKPTANLSFDLISTLDTKGKTQETFSLIERGAELSRLAGTTVSILTTNSSFSSENKLMSLVSDLSFLYQEGQRITLEQNNATLSKILKNNYSKLLSVAQVLPQILGYDSEKKYLFLFQNNEELRPTGGFIGSIGTLSISKGVIKNFSIQDVYSLDGQLKIHVEPPFIVRRYLQPHLYLRDSNFYLNYQEAASKSALIYNLETGKTPDAVIAIDLTVLKKIMKLIGPIKIPEYNVTVDQNNISSFLESTIQSNFFPGSTQKKDVLNKVLNQLIAKVSSNSRYFIEIAKLIPNLLDQKDILVAFNDQAIQKVFSAENYGGELSNPVVADNKTIKDFLYINEANIGANKANASIQRQVEYNAMIGTNSLQSKATLSISNTNQKLIYKTYIEAVVPRGSSLTAIKFNGEKQTTIPAVTDPKIYEAKNFKTPVGLEIEQYDKNQYTIFAFIASIQPNKKEQIEIDYNNGATIPLSTIVNYTLRYLKQPGEDPYTLTTSMYYPDGYMPINSSADSYGKNFLSQTSQIKTDTTFKVNLQKSSSSK